MYVLNIHNMPKIFWGAWPLIIFERPKCSKVLVPLSKLSVSKNVWFTNAILGPLDFIHSEMLKRGMGGSGPSGKQPLGSTISGAGPPLGATKGYLNTWLFLHSFPTSSPTCIDSCMLWPLDLGLMFVINSPELARKLHGSAQQNLRLVSPCLLARFSDESIRWGIGVCIWSNYVPQYIYNINTYI